MSRTRFASRCQTFNTVGSGYTISLSGFCLVLKSERVTRGVTSKPYPLGISLISVRERTRGKKYNTDLRQDGENPHIFFFFFFFFLVLNEACSRLSDLSEIIPKHIYSRAKYLYVMLTSAVFCCHEATAVTIDMPSKPLLASAYPRWEVRDIVEIISRDADSEKMKAQRQHQTPSFLVPRTTLPTTTDPLFLSPCVEPLEPLHAGTMSALLKPIAHRFRSVLSI